ncbi:MAG: acetyltransferase [Sphingobacteriales bacterium]|nr:MAG: acetyltransferase [Sphingobacteriales bacterium]
MNKIAFVGFGELGEQLWEFIQHRYMPALRITFDDALHAKGYINAHAFSDYMLDTYQDYHFFIGLGYRRLGLKQEVLNTLKSLGRSLPSFVHQSCYISHSSEIGEASYLYPCCNIDRKVKIGNGVLLNNSVTVSHDTVLEDNCFLAPGVTLCGKVHIGNQTFIGAGTVVSNGVKIGEKANIGLGSVVQKDLPDGVSAIGNPVKILKKPLRLI